MYSWTPIIDRQASVKAALEAHFKAAFASTQAEAREARLRAEIDFIQKARAEMTKEAVRLEKWPKGGTIWERVAENKGYCNNHGIRWQVKDDRITWDVGIKWISDILGDEGEEYLDGLQKELKEAEKATETAHEREKATLEQLKAARKRYSWLIEYRCGKEAVDNVREA